MNLDVDGWLQLHEKDYWLFDKLVLSRKLGYKCGPAGMNVPKLDLYCVRPIMNMFGMGLHTKFERIEKSTNHLHPGEFWCETFYGKHVSVDYLDKEPVLTVVGERDVMTTAYKWSKWTKVDNTIPFPKVLNELVGVYPKTNCEFIDGNLIEVHLRHNPDFRFGNTVAIPVWDERDAHDTADYKYVPDPDQHRLGFLVDNISIDYH